MVIQTEVFFLCLEKESYPSFLDTDAFSLFLRQVEEVLQFLRATGALYT